MRITFVARTLFEEAVGPDEVERGWSIDLECADTRTVTEVLEAAVPEIPAELRAAVPGAENAGSWSLHVGLEEHGRVRHDCIDARSLYAVNVRGLVSFPNRYDEMVWGDMLRAVADGYYGHVTEPQFVIAAPAPGVGGVGDLPTDVIRWLFENAPAFFVGYLGESALDQVRDRADLYRDRRVRKLADSWATRKINSPHRLRSWLETKSSWRVTEVAARLELNEAAAGELLASVGFEDNERGAMSLKIADGAMRNRDRWIGSEVLNHQERLSALGNGDSAWPSEEPGRVAGRTWLRKLFRT